MVGRRAGAARRAIARLAGVAAAAPADPRRELVELRLRIVPGAALLARLAAVPEVLWVGPAPARLLAEDEGTTQVVAGNVRDRQPQLGYRDWLARTGLDGAGVRLSVADVGVDAAHADLAPRVVSRLSYGSDEPSGGHGTHVAGILGGAANLQGGVEDTDGFLLGLGVAPKVEIVDQHLLAPGFPPEDGNFERYTRDALRSGASLWNASWTTGEGTGAGYIESARKFDVLARDGDFETPGAQPFTLVFSAGNSGPGASTLTAPKEAKNLIAVAASNSHRIEYELGSTQPSDIDTIAGFSSRGPARDGRMIPLVTAPGQGVMSTRTSQLTAADCTLPAEAAVARPEPASQPYYAYCSGTSMAAPHIAGAVALITQWWRRDHGGADPSPAMAKALLVDSATDMGDRDAPNPHEGWGRVNLGTLFDPARALVTVDQTATLQDAGGCLGLRVAAADPARPLRATLAWTDAPGAPDADPALVNDLDLTVAGAGGEFRGNVIGSGVSVAGGDFDRLNNVEGVVLPGPGGGYDVVVRAANLPGDGVPGGDGTDQDFALVLSNAVPLAGAPAACAPPAAAPGPVADPKKKKASAKRKAAKRKAARRRARCRARARRIDAPKRRRAALRRCARIKAAPRPKRPASRRPPR